MQAAAALLCLVATPAFFEDPARPLDYAAGSRQLHPSSPTIWLTPTISNATVAHVLSQIPTDEKVWSPCIGQVC